jgi:hypothetical protein
MASTGWRWVPGQYVAAPGGDQPCRLAASLQERSQILLAPDVIDDQQNSAVAQRLAELGGCGLDGLDAGALTGQDLDQVGNDGQQICRIFPKFRPQHAVEVGVLDVGVMCQCPGQRGLAIAAGALSAAVMATASPLASSSIRFRAANSADRGTKSAGGSGAIIGTRFCRLGPVRTLTSLFQCSGRSRS